jgi:ketosteroid isomerase-like protein
VNATSPDVELLQRAWDAMAHGDLAVVEAALRPDARWRAVEDGPWNCENREAIIDVMSRNLADGLSGRIEETIQEGRRILVAFRGERPRDRPPFEGGVAYVVVTMDDGRILEMKGCANREAAIAYMRTGEAPHPLADP